MIYDEVRAFYQRYKGKKCIIGYSFSGREIHAFHVGSEYGKQFIAAYAVHGREWITARLALCHIKRRVHCGGWIIPLVNPDGATISQTRNSMWKANARGVDINCNFDADWGTGALNTRTPGGENCIGAYPVSECETAALVRFTLRVKPFTSVSFHTKGGEIYWEYGGEGDIAGAEIIARTTGYQVKKIVGSAGGYKDWCIQKLGIAAYTIECGSDSLAHPITRLCDIKECKNILRDFTKYYGSQIYEGGAQMRKKGF